MELPSPTEDLSYPSLEALVSAINEYAAKAGYAVFIKRLRIARKMNFERLGYACYRERLWPHKRAKRGRECTSDLIYGAMLDKSNEKIAAGDNLAE